MENNNNPNPNSQVSVPLSQPLQQNIQLLNVRINDLLVTMNTVFKLLTDENQALRAELKKHNAPVETSPVAVAGQS